MSRKSHSSELVRATGIRPFLVVTHASASDQASNSIDTVSIQEMLARDAREFLLQTPDYTNRFAFYRKMEKMDPEITIARNYLTLMIQRSYLGPRLDESDKTYSPTPDFLSNVNIILSEIQFASKIGALAKDLIRHGNAFLRLRRLRQEKLKPEFRVQQFDTSEVIPPDSMTILSDPYIQKPKEFKGVISAKDYFVIAELKDRKDEPYRVVWDPEDEPAPSEDGLAPEIVLPARDVLHVSWDAEGSQLQDSFDRSTYGIWGQSVYESQVLYVKSKLAVLTDYVRWMRTGMPRWIMTANMDDIMNLANYPGNQEQKLKAALEEAHKVFREFEEELYYYDNNPESPTYRKKLPIEPDEVFVHSDRCTLEQKGGASSPNPAVMDMIKECNRAIASAMGVPLQLFNYNEGNTYATSKISAKFLAGYGGGLLRAIEIDLKEFLKSEFEFRGLVATPEDWENLYIEYDRDDLEEMKIKNEVDQGRAQVVNSLASAVRVLYDGGILSLNQCLMIMREGADGLKNLVNRTGGDDLKPLQPALPSSGQMGLSPTAQVHAAATAPSPVDDLMKKLKLPKDEPEMEDEVKQAMSDAFVFFIEEIARKVERGEVGGKEQ